VSDSTITFLVFAGVIVVFFLDLFPVAVVAIGVALALWATGVLDLNAALAAFGDPAVVFIAALFVVSESLDATGATTWAGQVLIATGGESRTRLVVSMLALVAVVTALISVNGAVAALLAVIVVTAVRLRRPPSQLLLGLFALTAVLGQLISNMATALIVFPVALSAAADLHVSARPALMCVTVSAAAALLTPVATPANLMVMEPAGPLHGLLEARPPAPRPVRRRGHAGRSRLLAVLAGVAAPGLGRRGCGGDDTRREAVSPGAHVFRAPR
jgi:di/tricarboxylate transporter